MADLTRIDLPPIPPSLLDAITGGTAHNDTGNGNSFKPRFDTVGALKGAPVGKRREVIFKLACSLRQANVPQDVAEELILKATRNCEQPAGDPFTEKEALAQVEDVYKRYSAGDGVVVISESSAPDEDDSASLSREQLTVEANETEGLSVNCYGGKSTDTAFPEVAWTGLFQQWRDIVAPCTEAALVNLWGAFLLAVGVIIGRNAWRYSPRPLFPNFYLLLLGQTGDSRKSTVMWLACELLRYTGVDFKELDGVVSSEGIFEALSDREGTKGLIYADEFRALLSVARRKGTQDILPKLNSLYYCPERSSIDRRKESTTIVRPFLSMVTATPQAYVEDVLTDLEVSGGFLNRFMVLSGTEQKAKPRVRMPSVGEWESIAAELRPIGERTIGHVEMTAEAETLWDDFYIGWKEDRRGWSPTQANLSARTFEHILKIAVVYSVLAGESTISAKILETSIAIGKWLQSNSLRLFADTGLDRFGKCERVIVDTLKRARGCKMWRRNLQQIISARSLSE
jgi:hypothetical protein